MIAGPSGTGKTVLSTHVIAEGVARGETGVLAIFDERPADYLLRAKQMGFDLGTMSQQGKIKILYLRPLDLSAEEILHQIQQAVSEVGAKRLVIDSLNGVELALASTFREDFRDSLYRLVNRLTAGGVSVLMTVEVAESASQRASYRGCSNNTGRGSRRAAPAWDSGCTSRAASWRRTAGASGSRAAAAAARSPSRCRLRAPERAARPPQICWHLPNWGDRPYFWSSMRA